MKKQKQSDPVEIEPHVISTELYNQKQEQKWQKAIEVWRKEGILSPQPQRVFYFFYNDEGEQRHDGFVAITNNGRGHKIFTNFDEAEAFVQKVKAGIV